MAVTAVHAGIGMHEAEDLSAGRSSNSQMVHLLQYALELITREPHTGHLETI
jgi:hypothetical protein